MISQSGGVGMSVLNLMANEGLGLNKFVSAGNMLNIQTEELLEYFIEDPGTKYILLYLEGYSGRAEAHGGRPEIPQAHRGLQSRILVSSANPSPLPTPASLSSNDRVVDAAFRQCGIVRVNDATTLGNDLKILRLPPMRGQKSGDHLPLRAAMR